VRLGRVEGAPRAHPPADTQERTRAAGQEGREHLDALGDLRLTRPRRRDAGYAHDDRTVQCDERRLGSHEAEQRGEHRVEPPQPAGPVSTEDRCRQRIVLESASENGDSRRVLVGPNVAYLDHRSLDTRHHRVRLEVPSPLLKRIEAGQHDFGPIRSPRVDAGKARDNRPLGNESRRW